MRDPVFNETMQVALVVDDIEATMRAYVEDYGIGPWDIYEFNPDTVSDLEKDGQPVACAWRLALAMVGGMQWELIQPLDDRSIYSDFLKAKGPGLHHVAVGSPTSYAETLESLTAKGHRVLLSGKYNGVTFAYLSTDDDMGVITEIFDWPEGTQQQPDAVYP